MIILAIETSCDDTSVSIMQDEKVISLVTISQVIQHNQFGGVMPEVAARLHSENILKALKNVEKQSQIAIKDINAIAVTYGPGLITSLQIGLIVAKTLSSILQIPIYKINHLDAHIFSPFINKDFKSIPKTFLGLILSGGNTILFKVDNFQIKILGKTLDDSIGESFDKIAKSLKLPYPGGPILEQKAKLWKGNNLNFPISKLKDYNFSFSGLKSHIMKFINNSNEINIEQIAYSFQTSVFDQVLFQLKKAIKTFGKLPIVVGGGVTSNEYFVSELLKLNNEVFWPAKEYATDNAAMIAYATFLKIKYNLNSENDKLNFDANPNLQVGEND